MVGIEYVAKVSASKDVVNDISENLASFQQQGRFADIVFYCSDGVVFAHQTILRPFTPNFLPGGGGGGGGGGTNGGQATDNDIVSVVLAEVTKYELQPLLNLIYTGFAIIDEKGFPSLVERLGIKLPKNDIKLDPIQSLPCPIGVSSEGYVDSNLIQSFDAELQPSLPEDINRPGQSKGGADNATKNNCVEKKKNGRFALPEPITEPRREMKTEMEGHFENAHKSVPDISLSVEEKIEEFVGICEGNNSQHEKENEKITCKKCQKIFSDLILLQKHMITVHKTKRLYKCDLCNLDFRRKENLKYHQAASVCFPEKRKYECKLCNVQSNHHQDMKRHITQKHGINEWKEWEQTYHNLENLPRNDAEEIESTVEKNENKCGKCGKQYKTTWSLKFHIKNAHDRTTFKCTTCKAKCGTLKSIRRHMIHHHGNDQWMKWQQNGGAIRALNCDKCGKKFATAYKLKYHNESRHEGIKYKCGICTKECLSPYYLKEHEIRVHGLHKEIAVKCPGCEQLFPNQCRMNQHLRSGHPMLAQPLKPTEDLSTAHPSIVDNLKCGICRKEYVTCTVLKEHEIMVHGLHKEIAIKCPECERLFMNQRRRNIHLRSHHPKLALPSKLKKDVGKNIQSKIVNLKCGVCTKEYVSPAVLKEHEITIHGLHKDVAVKCPGCERLFLNDQRRNQHLRVHHPMLALPSKKLKKGLGKKRQNIMDKNLKCNKCGKQYKKASSLKLHMKHHDESAQKGKLFKCDYCETKFSFRTNLRIHVDFIHGKDQSDE